MPEARLPSDRPAVPADPSRPPLDLARARAVLEQAARSAGRVLRERIDSIGAVRHKGIANIVTDVDVQSERVVRETILGAFPDHAILGEEGGLAAGASPRFRWIVDPLDGTTNYAAGFPFFCVSIGLEVDGALTLGAVYDPLRDELFLAERGQGAVLNGRPIHVSAVAELGQALLATDFPYSREVFPRAVAGVELMSRQARAVRRAGSAALDLCYVACGRVDSYWEWVVYPWDLAAGALLVAEAGGMVTRLDGGPFSVDCGQVLASNGLIHSDLVAALGPLALGGG